MTTNTNIEHCKAIAETLDNIANGLLYKCDECGEYVNINDYENNEELANAICDGDECNCPECDSTATFDQVSIIDWLEDALDFEYIITSDRQYKASRILVAWGGPCIYVNTLHQQVELTWWTDSATYPISNEASHMLDEAMEELYSC